MEALQGNYGFVGVQEFKTRTLILQGYWQIQTRGKIQINDPSFDNYNTYSELSIGVRIVRHY